MWVSKIEHRLAQRHGSCVSLFFCDSEMEVYMKLLDSITDAYLRKDIPQFNIGDTVQVSVRIVEGGKEKLQEFRGTVIARRGRGLNETFVVRKISFGEGVERTFYLHSPMIKSIEVIKKGKVRRAKLYYLRGKIGKKAKIEELEMVPESSIEAETSQIAEQKDVTESNGQG